MNQFRDAMNRALNQTVAAAQTNIPAGQVRDQLRGSALPPASATARGGVLLSDADPLANDVTADPGVSSAASRADHVHPSAGGGTLTIDDGVTTVSPVDTIVLDGATVDDDGGGQATIHVTGGGSGNSTSTGAAGSELGGPATGDLYLPDNGFVIERYSGSAWAPWGPLFPMTAPPTGGWTWDNQEAATISSANGGLALAEYTPTSNLNVRYRSLPSAPYTITLALLITVTPTTGSGTENIAGVVWRDSGGKIITVEFGHSNNASVLRVRKWNSSTSFSGSYYSTTEMPLFGPLIWVRLKDDNTNRMVQLSADGVNFITLHSVGRTDFLTADSYGLFVRPTGDAAIVTALSLG